MIRQFFIRFGVSMVLAIPLDVLGVNGWIAGFIGAIIANLLIDRFVGCYGEW